MQEKTISKLFLATAIFILAAWLFYVPANGALANSVVPVTLPDPDVRPTPPPDAAAVEQEAEDTLVIVKKIPKPPEKQPTAGPPAKQTMLEEEARIRAMWMESQIQQAKEARERAERTTNPAERQVLLKDAELKVEAAASQIRSIKGDPAPPAVTQPSTGASSAENAGQGSRIRFSSGALQQLIEVNRTSQDAAGTRNTGAASQRAAEAFGAGRAGAGGVALYKAATMLTSLDPSKLGSATVEDGRLVLFYDNQKIRFPALDLQYLAIAIRSVYDGEGLVKGTLLANEQNAIVLRTGKEQYGDVVWKKEFLPELPASLTVGQELALELGPGVGVLSLPEPSHDRVTYYGPLKGNILGHVVQESDMVFSMFWYGVDWKTGKPLDPNKLPGYESAMEVALNETAAPPVAPPAKQEESKNWWDETVWFVWTPDEISLQMTPQRSEFEFLKTTMKANVWSVVEENVRDSSRRQGLYLTQHYDDFARAFPILADLKEAAKAVAVVRWLKQNKVAISSAWAERYPLNKVNTPDTIQRYSVYVYRDKSGKPLVENAQ